MRFKYFKNYILSISFLITISLLAISCKSKKVIIEKSLPEKKVSLNHLPLLNEVQNKALTFKTFSAKAKSAVSLNKDFYDATLNIKIKYSEAIWISVTTLFGIEAARIFITPARFKMMNRLNGTYLNQPISFLNQFGSEEITFDNLQAMMVGNMITQAMDYTEEAEKNTDGYLLRGLHNNLNFSIQTDSDYKIISCLLSAFNGDRKVQTNYSDFAIISNQSVPQDIRLSATSSALKLDLQLKYNRIALNEALEMPFTIPSKYKELRNPQ